MSLEQTSSIILQNTKISLSEAGKGEPVLCLHGNPGNKNTFSEMMKKLDNTGIKLLALDRPGHNSTEELLGDKSDLWLDVSVYSELIDKKLGGKAWLLGHSYGCLTALKVAVKYPEKVNGIIMINPMIVPNKPKEKCSLIPSIAKGALLGTIFGVWLPNEYEDVFTDFVNKLYSPEKPSADVEELWVQKFSRFESVIAYLTDKNTQIRICSEITKEAENFKKPVSVLFGGKDALYDLQRQKEFFAAAMPGAKLETDEDAGHYMPVLNPETCVGFLKKSIKAQNKKKAPKGFFFIRVLWFGRIEFLATLSLRNLGAICLEP